MKIIRWNEEKNIKLRLGRGVSFEDVEEAILNDSLHSIEIHPDQEKYPNQKKALCRDRQLYLCCSVCGE